MTRIVLDVPEELGNRIQEIIPWGSRGELYRVMMRGLVRLVEEHGDIVVGAVLMGHVEALDLIKVGIGKEKK